MLVAAVSAFAATSPPSAFDEEKGEVSLDAATPVLIREVGLEVRLQGAFGSETVDFSCGMAWEEGAQPVTVRVTVEDLDAPAGTEPETMQVLSNVGTMYEDGSRLPGPHALVQLPIPCEGEATCTGRYRLRCELPEPPADRVVKVEWRAGARVRYDPGGLCGGDAETTLDVTSQEVAP